MKTLTLKIEICDGNATVTDALTGEQLKCTSIDIHVDARTFVPTLTLKILDFEAQVLGTFRCEEISREPLYAPEDVESR